jgi:hypothetical protein
MSEHLTGEKVSLQHFTLHRKTFNYIFGAHFLLSKWQSSWRVRCVLKRQTLETNILK